MSKNYIAQRGNDYFAVVEEDGKIKQEARISDAEVVGQIKSLLEERREAGEKITRLLIERGPITASAHNHATIALGEGEDPEGKEGSPKN